ncbi:MAG: transposase [Patescibacteria group bacterium]|nr:transposase [Patescibacteria group bacterium]
MLLIKPHHNSQKRFYGPDKIYFITTVTHRRFPFFKEDLFCDLFVENLRICKELKKFKLYAFIIIPDHIHLLLKPGNNFNISQIMHAIKRHFSRNANLAIVGQNDFIFDNEGEDCNPRLHLDVHNFNKNLIKYRQQFIIKYGNPQLEIPKFKWQKSFYDHVIRNEKDFLKHLNYIAFNCVKHKVCDNEEKYKWSNMNSDFNDFINDWQ